MGKDILQQLHQQECGIPVDEDVAKELQADSERQAPSNASKPSSQPRPSSAPQFTDDNPFGL